MNSGNPYKRFLEYAEELVCSIRAVKASYISERGVQGILLLCWSCLILHEDFLEGVRFQNFQDVCYMNGSLILVLKG